MATSSQPEADACLRTLAAQPGVLWVGLMNRTSPSLKTLNPDGSARQSGPAESVLVEAIMTASNALSERLGLGRAADFEHRFEQGGLLIHSPDTGHCLILCHRPEAPVPLLRMALRDAARHLPPAAPSAAPSMAEVFAFPDPGSLGGLPDFVTPATRDASFQSEVYNPFTSA